jgi:FkbM family methyltransferase
MTRRAKVLVLIALVAAATAGAAYANEPFLRAFAFNYQCCRVPFARNAVVARREVLGQARYYGEVGQDKWVLETMFPDVTDGFFLDVGSGHGTIGSNTKALERAGWKGICVDPFPVHMEGRTCQMFTEVVFSVAGRVMTFQKAGGLAGLAETLGHWNEKARQAPSVEFTTVTLDDILTRGAAPAFINFVSLDIEGAELEALKAFPFDRVRIGALAIEHNFEEPKRSDLSTFLDQHGYTHVHTWRQDDFYAPR